MMKKILLMLVALIATSFSAMAEDVYIVAGSKTLCGSHCDANDLSKFDYATGKGAKFVATLPGSEPAEPTYFMKHPWGGGEWTWKQMEKNTEEKFALKDGEGNVADYGWMVKGKWGNDEVYINSKNSDVDSTWVKATVVYNPQLGEDCRFFYHSLPKYKFNIVTVFPERVANFEVNFDPAPGTYTGPLTVHVKCLNMPNEISEIEYWLNGDYDNTLIYDDAKGIVLTENTILEVEVTLTDGNVFPIKGEYVINMPTGVDDITTTATTKAQKVIENGQVLIIKDGKKYNLLGNQVK